MNSAPQDKNVPAAEFGEEKFEMKGIKGKKSKLRVAKYQIKSTVVKKGEAEKCTHGIVHTKTVKRNLGQATNVEHI